MPALLTTPSWVATARPPASLISLTTSSAMLCPAPVPSREPPRSLTTTLAPSLARVSAYSRPRPPPAPVTTTTRSCTPGMKNSYLSIVGDQQCENEPASSEQPARQFPRLFCIRRVDEGGDVGSGRLG